LRRRFGKAFAKNHLAVYAAVDFVVYILDARSGQIRRIGVKHLIRINGDGCTFRRTHRHKHTENSRQDGSRFNQTGFIIHFIICFDFFRIVYLIT
jgi:hypothetical protein